MNQGALIVFEGINGCGKGTQLEKFTQHLYGLTKTSTIFRTREPNDFDNSGRKMREMLSSNADPYSYNLTMLKYFTQNRKAHNEIFVPMLEKGIHVLSDRYWHSNFAFQHSQKIPYEKIARQNRDFKIPDLTFIIDVSLDEVSNRLFNRDGKNRRKFDTDLDFLESVRKNYLELSSVLPDLIGDKSIVVINGNQSIDSVSDEIKTAYNSFLNVRDY